MTLRFNFEPQWTPDGGISQSTKAARHFDTLDRARGDWDFSSSTVDIYATTSTDPITFQEADDTQQKHKHLSARLHRHLKLSSDASHIIIYDVDQGEVHFVYKPDDEQELKHRLLRARRFTAHQRVDEEIATPINSTPWVVYSVRVAELLEEIQYHLLETTIDGGVTWQYYTFNEVLNYLRERISRFLMETGLVRDRTTLTLSAGTADYNLDSTLTDLFRVYLEENGSLPRVDKWMMDHSDPSWEGNSGTPRYFIEDPLDPLSVKVSPTPTSSATVSYTYVKQTPFDDAPEPSISGVNTSFVLFPIRVPAIFCWAIKYGVMADMWKREGEGNDPSRAAYSEQRYRDGVDLALMFLGELPE